MLPREKIGRYGPKKLESWELVATIIGTGVRGISIKKLSKKVNRVIETKKESIQIEDLLDIKGIGSVKAIQIISAFELSRRYFIKEYISIQTIDDVLLQVKQYRNKQQEYLLALTLDGASRLISMRVITIGLLNQSLAHPREVFAQAIEERAHSIILVHNHPSGINQPSREDIRTTQIMQKTSEIIGIKLQDHIIVTREGYFSFLENQLL